MKSFEFFGVRVYPGPLQVQPWWGGGRRWCFDELGTVAEAVREDEWMRVGSGVGTNHLYGSSDGLVGIVQLLLCPSSVESIVV